ncbi:hypothetical protein ACFUIY_19385 [Streptomyces griseorubiginosus]|uniref:hypothetical protein n=1 Tax=Streptomyces griseorubiginosus TaxID=67304 RepID=UPI003637C7B7
MFAKRDEKNRPRRTLGTAIKVTAATAAMVGASLFATAAPASATEGSCKGPFWGWFQQNVCLVADMGGKNVAARSQWVGRVEGNQGSYADPNVKMEIWGDGFYYANKGVVAVNVNKWVRDGTNICAAETEPSGWRQITCIAIHVP